MAHPIELDPFTLRYIADEEWAEYERACDAFTHLQHIPELKQSWRHVRDLSKRKAIRLRCLATRIENRRALIKQNAMIIDGGDVGPIDTQ